MSKFCWLGTLGIIYLKYTSTCTIKPKTIKNMCSFTSALREIFTLKAKDGDKQTSFIVVKNNSF